MQKPDAPFDFKAVFGTDKKAEIEGRDIVLATKPYFAVRIARANNERHTEKLQALLKEHRIQLKTKTLPDEVLKQIAIKAMVGTVLLSWEGEATFGKEPVPAYSEAAAIKLLTDYPDFRDFVAENANDIERFREEVEDDAAKNSPSTSAGDVS